MRWTQQLQMDVVAARKLGSFLASLYTGTAAVKEGALTRKNFIIFYDGGSCMRRHADTSSSFPGHERNTRTRSWVLMQGSRQFNYPVYYGELVAKRASHDCHIHHDPIEKYSQRTIKEL